MDQQFEIKKEFGERIKFLRKYRKLSLRKLAALADMEHSHLNLIEKGAVSPSIAVFKTLAEALNLPYCLFFDNKFNVKSEVDILITDNVKQRRIELKISSKLISEYLKVDEFFAEDVEGNILNISYSISQLFELSKRLECPISLFLSK